MLDDRVFAYSSLADRYAAHRLKTIIIIKSNVQMSAKK
jgi:hypothetical protein